MKTISLKGKTVTGPLKVGKKNQGCSVGGAALRNLAVFALCEADK